MKRNRVLILGCGPAGLISAWAALSTGAEVIIVSSKKKSDLFGCQYLHEKLPDLPLRSEQIDYVVRGTYEQYREKVYGDKPIPVPISPVLYEGPARAYDIRSAYEMLWNVFGDAIEDAVVKPTEVQKMLTYYDAATNISTIPLPALCQRPDAHYFNQVQSYAMGSSPWQAVPVECPKNTVVCDGTDEVSFYRKANVFEHTTVEWPGHRKKPPLRGVVPFVKPINTTCDCWTGAVIHRIGRHGRWQKGVLAHTAYKETINAIMLGNPRPEDTAN